MVFFFGQVFLVYSTLHTALPAFDYLLQDDLEHFAIIGQTLQSFSVMHAPQQADQCQAADAKASHGYIVDSLLSGYRCDAQTTQMTSEPWSEAQKGSESHLESLEPLFDGLSIVVAAAAGLPSAEQPLFHCLQGTIEEQHHTWQADRLLKGQSLHDARLLLEALS